MNEEWRRIEGYADYEVSNLGRIKSYKHTSQGRLVSCFEDYKGYLAVNLRANNKQKTLKVHRLVAQAFIPNPENKPTVNHIDEFQKTNNSVENLGWMTMAEQNSYGTRTKRTSNPVAQYTLDGELVETYPSGKAAGRAGFNSGGISACCHGKTKTHGGYTWKFIEKGEKQ